MRLFKGVDLTALWLRHRQAEQVLHMEYAEGLYRTKDDLKNFHIKVDLYRLGQGGGVGGRPFIGDLNSSRDEQESYTFTWQKKAFSQREFEFYSDARNCTTALESRYNREITKQREEGGRQNGRLFCYIEGDQPYIPQDLMESPQIVIDSSHIQPTFATQYSSAVRRRHTTRKQIVSTGVKNPVLKRPSMEQRLAHRINTPCPQSMYIMADLRHTVDGIEIWDEAFLCLIQVNDSGMVSVKPDFNTGQSPYRIETKNRDVYEYHIEQVTEVVPTEYTIQEKNLQTELYHRKNEKVNERVGTEFTSPPEGGTLSVHILGEIVSAYGFEYDDLYITAHLKLPEFWELIGEQGMSIITQISRTKSKHLYNIANFNCPFEYELIYHNITTIQDDLGQWPCVVVKVCSLDSWDRHRVEGYAQLPLPRSPGVYEVGVHTWRPSGSRVVDRLKRFFVGGGNELSDISYITKPPDFDGCYLSKYGFQTESSGTVNFRFNIVHHSSAMMQKFQSEQLTHAMSRHMQGGLKTSLAATLGAFQRARQKAASVTATLNS